MKLSQKNIIRIILVAFIALYNFLLFIITSDVEKTAVFWISYGFIMLAPVLLLLLTVVPLTYTSGTNLVLSLPTYRTIIAYCAFEFIVGTLFMFIQHDVYVKVALLVQVPLLIVFAIIFFIYLLGATHISNNYAKQKSDVFSKNQIYVSVSMIARSTSSVLLADRLNMIAEKVKYSDFNSYPETKSIEDEIRLTVSALQYSSNDETTAMSLASKLDLLVEQRRETCKYIKKMRG